MTDDVIRIQPDDGSATLTGGGVNFHQRVNRIEGTIEAIVDVFCQQTRHGKNYATIEYDERDGLRIVFSRRHTQTAEG